VEDDVRHRTSLSLGFAALTMACLAGCAGAPPAEDNPLQLRPADTASADTGDSKPPPKSDPGKSDDLNDAQREQMEIALRRGGDKAGNCDRVVPGTTVGEGEVKVTFDGKKGRAIDVTVPAPWTGTDAEGCIKRAFIGEIIVPFDGQLEVPYTIKVGKKAAAPDPKAKGKK
jgi:hypothetical protein